MTDPFKDDRWIRLQGFLCLIPIFGLVPSGWFLSRKDSDRRLRHMSRLSVTLGLLWGLGFFLMNTGAGVTQVESFSPSTVSMLFGNTLWSSSYFMTLLWLMMRHWRGQAIQVPGVSKLAKYLP